MKLIHIIQSAIVLAVFMWSVKVILTKFVLNGDTQHVTTRRSTVLNDHADDDDGLISINSLGRQRVELPIPPEEQDTTTSVPHTTNNQGVSSTVASTDETSDTSTPLFGIEDDLQTLSTILPTLQFETSTLPSDFGTETTTTQEIITEPSILEPSTTELTDSTTSLDVGQTDGAESSTTADIFTTPVSDLLTETAPQTTTTTQEMFTTQVNEMLTEAPETDMETTIQDGQAWTSTTEHSTTELDVDRQTTQQETTSQNELDSVGFDSTTISLPSTESASSTTEDNGIDQEDISSTTMDAGNGSTEPETSATENSGIDQEDISSTTIDTGNGITEPETSVTENSGIDQEDVSSTTMDTGNEITEPETSETTTITSTDELLTEQGNDLLTTTAVPVMTDLVTDTTDDNNIGDNVNTEAIEETSMPSPSSTQQTQSIEIDQQTPSSFDQTGQQDTTTTVTAETEQLTTVSSVAEEVTEQPTIATSPTSQTEMEESGTSADQIPNTTPTSGDGNGDGGNDGNDGDDGGHYLTTTPPPTTTQTTLSNGGEDETISSTSWAPFTTTMIDAFIPNTSQTSPQPTARTTAGNRVASTSRTTPPPTKTAASSARQPNIGSAPPFWIRFWPNHGWDVKVNPCHRRPLIHWQHEQQHDELSPRGQASFVEQLWHRMFRLQQLRCEMSYQRRNIQHGLLETLEMYRQAIQKEILTLSETLKHQSDSRSWYISTLNQQQLLPNSNTKTQEELIRLNQLLQLTNEYLKILNRFNHYEWITK